MISPSSTWLKYLWLHSILFVPYEFIVQGVGRQVGVPDARSKTGAHGSAPRGSAKYCTDSRGRSIANPRGMPRRVVTGRSHWIAPGHGANSSPSELAAGGEMTAGQIVPVAGCRPVRTVNAPDGGVPMADADATPQSLVVVPSNAAAASQARKVLLLHPQEELFCGCCSLAQADTCRRAVAYDEEIRDPSTSCISPPLSSVRGVTTVAANSRGQGVTAVGYNDRFGQAEKPPVSDASTQARIPLRTTSSASLGMSRGGVLLQRHTAGGATASVLSREMAAAVVAAGVMGATATAMLEFKKRRMMMCFLR